ncbi:MAG: tyrosine-type recombinase/integrase [Jatrophihabitans sp.]|uniref:tyrosine-type recombinase/integrase n=1 Tax=Jatrophihabitans sp. TaxID=1932789 RepID=UPI003F803A81
MSVGDGAVEQQQSNIGRGILTDMGHSYRRLDDDGKPRYAAIYRDARGRRRSAGTFPTKREADRAWAAAEADAQLGRVRDLQAGRVRFATYVTEIWFPHHQIEPSTRQRYASQFERHLLPEFGPMRLIDITPQHVREWITRLKDQGVSPSTITSVKVLLSAVFTTAVNDQLVLVHPCRGVRTPTVARPPRTIITPEQFDAIHAALPGARWQVMVELDIESGLRWGELTELRVHDWHPVTGMLTVARAVTELNARFRQPGQGRFVVKDYPKNTHTRRVRLSPTIADTLTTHITELGLRRNDLIFALPCANEEFAGRSVDAGIDGGDPRRDLGMTTPNPAGRAYPHGTLTAYNLGACRCHHCRQAAADYRAARRARGHDRPRVDRATDNIPGGHIPRRWFSTHIWWPALAHAGIDFPVRMHDLRHAHASWLLAGGADIQTVKQRLGHGSLRTTEKYLHTLPDTDTTALDALHRIRNRGRTA